MLEAFDSSVAKKFDDPFLLPSSDYFPDSLSAALDFCRFLYYLVPEYKEASKRVVRYFVTDLIDTNDSGKGSSDEKAKFKDYLINKLNIYQVLSEMGDDWAIYGNSFYRMHFPFIRFLVDDRGDRPVYYSIDMFKDSNIQFNEKDLKYIVPDPRNNFKSTVELDFKDSKNRKGTDNIRLIKLDPRYIDIEFSEISGEAVYIQRFSESIKNSIKTKKSIFHINETPKYMLEAIFKDKNFQYASDQIFHFKSPSPSGFSKNGWGIPEPIANFRAIFQVQLYRKIDEAVAMDYYMPFRILSPAQSLDSSGGNIPGFASMSMDRWGDEINNIVKNRRKDKFAINSVPFPVRYDEFGADGKTLAPKDLIQYQTNSLLDSLGYPAEIFRSTLNMQQMPTAIRLFEKRFWFIHQNFNQFLNWVSTKYFNFINAAKVSIGIEAPSVANDIDRQNIILQLGMSGELPRSEYLKRYVSGDPIDAIKKRREEDLDLQIHDHEINEEAKAKMEAMQSINADSAQQGVGGEGGTTPLDIEQQAIQLAEQWLSMDDGQRRQAMTQMKSQNVKLYSLAKQMMEEIRNQGASVGRQAANQQYKQ